MPGSPLNKKKRHYVDNKKFYAEIVKYKQSLYEAEESGEEKPRIPDYLGECLYKIATNLSYSPKFIGYSYREEMVADALETMVLYFDRFNEKKYNNPFAYYTQIGWYSFLRRIHKEQRNQYINYKMIERELINDSLVNRGAYDTGGVGNLIVDFDNDNINSFIQNYEDKLEEKKEKSRTK